MENDLFAGTDRQYTSGVKLGWSSKDLANYSDSPYASPFLPLFNLLPYINEQDYQKDLVFAFGQNIYTPDDTEAFDLIEGDRPYSIAPSTTRRRAPAPPGQTGCCGASAFGAPPLTALDAADVAAVNLALECQVFLRPAQLLPCGANALAEDAEWHLSFTVMREGWKAAVYQSTDYPTHLYCG